MWDGVSITQIHKTHSLLKKSWSFKLFPSQKNTLISQWWFIFILVSVLSESFFLITAQRTSTELMDRAVPSPYPKGRSHEGAFMDSRHDLQSASHLRQKREVNTDFQPSISSLNSWMRYLLVFSRTSVSSDWLANIQLRSSHRIQNFCNTFTCQIPVEIPRIQCPISPMKELTGIH